MKVSIVTEGFQNTGYGHITRCLSLYQAFEEKNITPIFYVNGDENAKNYLAGSNYKILNWLTHPTKLFSEISGSDILIIDSYHAGKEYYETLSKLSKIALYIDDFIRLDYPAGIILNGTINAETFRYKKNPGYDYLLGVKYIPIRKEFWNEPARKINPNISTILITYGGQDIKNLTIPTVKAVQNNFPMFNINVVVGGGDLSKKEFEKLKNGSTEIYYSVEASKMKELMFASDVAITAAGQTLYELAATGTPSIAVSVVDNQKNNIVEWKKSGFLIDAIFHGDSNYLKKILEQLNSMKPVSMRKKFSTKGKIRVDGQGSRRAVDYIINKLFGDGYFYLRKASDIDASIVFELSNDTSVREQSINKNSIDYNDHIDWYSGKIRNDKCLFLLAFGKENSFIGQIRFDIEETNAVISISISKQFRGKGLSKKLLLSSCGKIFYEHKNIKNIIAYIRPDNAASIKSFKSAKFVFVEKTKIDNELFEKAILKRED